MSDVQTGAAPAAPEPAAIAPAQTAEPTVSEPVKSEPVNIEAALTAAYDKINPPRENGKFAAKESEGVEPAAPTPDQPPAEAAKPAEPAIEPPTSWSADMKAKWAALPPDAQQYIAQRESEAHKRISQFGEQVKAIEPVAKIAQQHKNYFAAKGATPEQWFQNIVGMSQMFDQNPVQVLEHLAQQKGIDLRSVYSGQPPNQMDQYIRSLEQRVARAEQLANKVHTDITKRAEVENNQKLTSIVSVIEKFAKDRPDYAELESEMLPLVEAIRDAEPDASPEDMLSKAYEKARWSNPKTREKLLSEQRKAEEVKRAEEQKKKAEEARKLGSINVKSTSGANPTRKGNWEDTLRAVGERIA